MLRSPSLLGAERTDWPRIKILFQSFFLDLRVSPYLSATTKITLCHDKRFFSNDDDNGEHFPQKVCRQCLSQEFSLDLTNSFSGTLEKGKTILCIPHDIGLFV